MFLWTFDLQKPEACDPKTGRTFGCAGTPGRMTRSGRTYYYYLSNSVTASPPTTTFVLEKAPILTNTRLQEARELLRAHRSALGRPFSDSLASSPLTTMNTTRQQGDQRRD